MSSVYEQLAQLSPARRALFEQRLAARGLQANAAQAIPARAADAAVPLSFAQQRLWFLQQFAPGSTAYNLSSVLRLGGRIDHRALRLALNDVIARHEALRTSFVAGADGTPVQRIHPHVALELPVTDLSAETDPQAAATALVDAMRGTAFDLSVPPLRLALLARAADDHLLVMCTHHIVCDRWSVMVFLRELSASYAAHTQAGPAALSALPIQYGDWTLWQREQLQGEKLARLLDYWRTRLAALPAALDLPTDRPAPAVAGTAGAQWPLAFSAELTAGLRALANRERTTLFTVLLAAFQALLHRYTGATDVVVGTEVANRDRPETAGLLGLLVNTLVLRGDLSGDPSYRTLLEQTREHVLGALAHQELPFEKLVETLNPARGLHQMTPLFEVKFDLQQVPVRPPAGAGLAFEREALTETDTKYLLRFNLQDGADGLRGQIEYSTDRFDAETIARMAEHYAVLLAGVVAAPERRLSTLPLLPTWERERLLVEWNRTQAARPEGTLHALVAARAAASPSAVAVIDGDREWTYRELDECANRLAARLIALGVGAEQPVGVSMARRGELIVALLGILKAGGAYVPLDPAYPAQRLSFIAADAGMRLVLNDGTDWPAGIAGVELLDVAELIAPTAPVPTPAVKVAPAQLAYVIYTSGSTGRPKGVAIEHRSAVALMHWARARFDATELAGVLAATSICFDLSVFEIFVPLAWGGTLILAENVLALPELPARERVSLINTVPSVMRQLLERGALPASAATVNLAGEALPLALVRELQALPQVRHFYNLYGPSEDTTYSTCAPLAREEFGPDCARVTIGAPIENTQAYVLDAHGEPVPIGIAGELYLGGAGLARGYFGRAAQTAASFMPNPFAAEPPVLYRTGDRARRLPDGSLEFLGRDDHQIKIRGFRIEAGEIEAALREHPALRDALVIAHEDARGDRRLLAYVVGDERAAAAPAGLRAFLAERLPAHAIPSLWVCLPALPRLPNGKIDRSALPSPDPQEARSVEVRAPRTLTERTLCALWCDLLQRSAIGIDEDFFDLGGHSLLAFQLVARIENACGCRVALRALFQHSTIASLAAHVDELERVDPSVRRSTPRPPLAHDAAGRAEPFPLTDIQQAYWLGRSGVFELGNIATHGYREIETGGLAVTAVEQALNALIRRHDMLRVVVTPEGQQRVLPEVPTYAIALTDLRGLSTAEADAALSALRERLSHQLFAPDTWPLFQIEAALHGDGRARFFVSFDVLIGDAWSLQILGREMGRLLLHESLPPLALCFRDYVLTQAAQTTTEAYRQSFDYWRARLPELPPAPELPLLLAPSQLETPRFVRRSAQLPAASWTALKTRARRAGLTPTSLVLAAFAEVLATWSRRRAFTLNLTLFNRDPVHPDVEKLVGDFTSSLLLAVDAGGDLPFARQAACLQARLLEDLEHRAVSGVRILRELARDSGRRTGALMPVVFTSTLSQPATSTPQRGWQAQVIYGVSQTSQVYFDHQVSETDGALTFNWDTIDALFPAGLLDDMFAAYAGFLERLATADDAFEQRPRLADAGYLDAFNDTALFFDADAPTLLHTRFFEHARARPAAPAVLTAEICLSYGELAQRVLALAAVLRSHEIARNELVAIGIAKGWTQVVAALAVLTAGGAYVPIDPELPSARRAQLLADTASRIVLVDARSPDDWPAEVLGLAVDTAAPDIATSLAAPPTPLQAATDLAYVIYTSGSTGMPKGVMIDHRGAMNTVLDLNARFDLRADDRVFALSALNFDLSVYDLFGPLTAGAALVMPDAARLHDTRHWCELLNRHEVTIWNSVPALMQLLVTELEGEASAAPPSALRLALLSGDWIPVPLPATLARRLPRMKVVSLGGATEASIWSIAHPIDTVDPAWKSIPYGRPLANQQWYVLDERMAPCPPWVTGQLYIGGSGLARGYWRRPALSAEQFVPNPFATSAAGDGASCLYRTGDLGRYCAEGHLEFLGREDFQVKINGHRIELGEIETALQQHPLIAQAVVTVIGSPPELLAYVVPALGESDAAQDPLARLDFKRARHAHVADDSAAGIALPPPATTAAHLARQSHRRFLPQPIPFEAFAALLGELSAQTLAAAPLPKFRYPSAGSLYPIEVYLSIKHERVAGLDGGWYRYEPHAHRLLPVATHAAPDTACCYGPNAAVFAESAFSLFLIADLAAIEPLYGERARDFCLLEAGYIGQLLMECAPAQALGLCPVNDPELAALRELLALSEHQTPVHALLGGAIDAAWSSSWRALDAPRSASLAERLQASLRDRLPAYMVPGRYHLLDKLPLSPNGKIDRRALPVPHVAAERAYTPPRNALEARVAELWATLLEIERVGVEDDFFQLGGNSLLALQLLTQLRQHFAVDLAIADLFGALTPAAQAALIASAQATTTTPATIQAIARTPPAASESELSDEAVDALLAKLLNGAADGQRDE